MAFKNPFPSLLGMNNQQPDPYQSLLGGYYTPQQAKMAWLGGTLQGIGAGLASGKSGAWAQGAALGGGAFLTGGESLSESLTTGLTRGAVKGEVAKREESGSKDITCVPALTFSQREPPLAPVLREERRRPKSRRLSWPAPLSRARASSRARRPTNPRPQACHVREGGHKS